MHGGQVGSSRHPLHPSLVRTFPLSHYLNNSQRQTPCQIRDEMKGPSSFFALDPGLTVRRRLIAVRIILRFMAAVDQKVHRRDQKHCDYTRNGKAA